MKKIKKLPKHERMFAVIFIAAAAAAVFYILPPYNADIINYDSAYQFFLTRKSLPEMARLIPEDYSPPLYSLLLKLWCAVFGETLASMRAASLVSVWGMLFLAAYPIRTAFGKRTSLLCTVFYLFSAINFTFIPEIRPNVPAYFLVTACAVYAYLAFFRGKKYAYICLTAFSILAMYTHNIGMLSALAIYLTALVMSLCGKKYAQMKRFLISGIVCAVCYLPWLTVVLKQFGSVKKNYWSSGEWNLSRILNWSFYSNLTDFDGNFLWIYFPPVFALTLCVLFLSAAGKFKIKDVQKISELVLPLYSENKERLAKLLFLILMFAGPVAAILIFSLVGHPIIAGRYFYIFCGITMLLLAVFASKCGKKAVAAGAAVMIAANFCLAGVNLKKQLDESDFIAMTEQIQAENPDGDIAFLHSHEWTLGIMMYYFPNAKHYVFDETWCVLNTYDVFPAEVINIGALENIADYEKEFYVFGGRFPDTETALDSIFESDEDFLCEQKGVFTEPYTYQKGWILCHVKG